MNQRLLLLGLAVVLTLAAISGVTIQRNQLTALRAEQRRLLAESAAPDADSPQAPAAETAKVAPAVSPELLRLRSEVTRLTRQRDELASASVENQRLRAQAARHATNTASGAPLPPGYVGADQGEFHVVGAIDPNSTTLPPGYVRANQARMAGYKTPEDTLETMLWAVHNRDLTNLLQAFTSEEAQQLQKQAGRSGGDSEAFFRDAGAIPGLSIVSQEQMPDGSISMKTEVVPGIPFHQIRFRQINGQWKMEMGK